MEIFILLAIAAVGAYFFFSSSFNKAKQLDIKTPEPQAPYKVETPEPVVSKPADEHVETPAPVETTSTEPKPKKQTTRNKAVPKMTANKAPAKKPSNRAPKSRSKKV